MNMATIAARVTGSITYDLQASGTAGEIGGKARRLKPRATVEVPRGAWHRIENPGRRPVVVIEVQHGPHLVENDIVRRQDDYGRAGR